MNQRNSEHGPRPLRRLWAAAIAVGLLAAALPATASAGGTVLLGKGPGQTITYGGFTFTGGNEENNVFLARANLGDRGFVLDAGGPNQASGGPCTQGIGVGIVSCVGTYPSSLPGAGGPILEFHASLGGGADKFRVPDPSGSFLLFGEVRGGTSPDRIAIGTATSNPSPGGRYFVRGEGGRDRISIGDHGTNNLLIGGSGSDFISSFRNGRQDNVICGGGALGDSAIVDLQDVVSVTCESVRRAPKDQHPTVKIAGKRKPKVRNGRVAVRLKCPKGLNKKRCKGKLIVKKGRKKKGRKLGFGGYKIKRGKKRTVRVRVRGRRGTARVIAREKGTDKRPKTAIKQLRLR